MRRFTSVLMAASLLACGRSSSSPPLQEIEIALPSDRITWLPVELAPVLGYAEAEGIRLSISETTGLGKGVEALLGGSVQMTAGTLMQVIQLAADGRPLRCFVVPYTRPQVVIAVAPGMTDTIRTPRDLAGQRVGVASAGSASNQFLDFIVATQGLAPKDVHALAVGTGAPSLAALEHGTVDAGVLLGAAISTFQRRHPEATLLVDTRSAEGARRVFTTEVFPNTCVMAEDEWLSAHADTARRFTRAVVKTMAWMGAHSAEEIRDRMPESMHVPDAEAELDAIRHVKDALSADGATSPDATEAVRRFVATYSEKVRNTRIDLTRTYTNDFVSGR